MSDLLDLLGDEWALPVEDDEGGPKTCGHRERAAVTHGCRESGRPALHWSDVGDEGYVDGMGRRARCNYCASCVGSGRVMIRDPWSGFPLVRAHASCIYCQGTGWIGHAWDCDQRRLHDVMSVHEPIPATHFGVAFPNRTVIPGEVDLPEVA